MNNALKLILALFTATTLSSCNAFVNSDESGDYECDVYCNIMMEGCSETFSELERCFDACEDYPFVPQEDENGVIPFGERVDNEDSFECRIYHGQTALNIARTEAGETNNFHCKEAAPLGGGTCSDARLECATFCHDALTTCEEVPTKEGLDNCEERCERELQQLEDSGQDPADSKFQCRRSGVDAAMAAEEESREQLRDNLCDAAQSDMPCANLLTFRDQIETLPTF